MPHCSTLYLSAVVAPAITALTSGAVSPADLLCASAFASLPGGLKAKMLAHLHLAVTKNEAWRLPARPPSAIAAGSHGWRVPLADIKQLHAKAAAAGFREASLHAPSCWVYTACPGASIFRLVARAAPPRAGSRCTQAHRLAFWQSPPKSLAASPWRACSKRGFKAANSTAVFLSCPGAGVGATSSRNGTRRRGARRG